MANPYTSQTISGYNSNPPPNDGSTGSNNEANWDTHVKTKIGDPVKVLAEGIDSAILSAFAKRFGNSTLTKTATYTLAAGDEGKMLIFTAAGGYTLDLLAAATATDGFAILIDNATTGNVTIDPNGAELVNGAATVVLATLEKCILVCTGTAWRLFHLKDPAILVTLAGTQTLTNKTLTSPTITTPSITGGLAVAQGGTGATTAAGARTNLGAMGKASLAFDSATSVAISSGTTVIDLSMGSLTSSDVVMVVAWLQNTKGVTGGNTQFDFSNVGTATGGWAKATSGGGGAGGVNFNFPSQPANSTWAISAVTFYTISGNGTVTIRIAGTSNGSNGTANAFINAWVI